MDFDSSLYDVAKGFYIEALNITKNELSANNDFAAANIVGNRKISFSYPSGRGKTIGAFSFQLRNTVIFFRWNVNGNHGVYECNLKTRVITKIFENLTDSGGIDILGFTENSKITSVNVYPRDEGDLLFFLDSLGRPTEMDISQFKAGTYIPVTRDIIEKGKMPPLSPPQVVYDNYIPKRSNTLRNKLFRFKYRWIYDDFEKSVFSPISIVPLPVSILSDVYTSIVTNNNVIRMTLNSGGKNVKSVEIAMSYVEKTNDWSDFQSVEVVDKSKLGIIDDTDFAFAFYNDSTYPDIDINESIQLFDYVPDYANAQEMPNGNVLLYGGITEGYNKDTIEDAIITVLTVPAGNGGVVGSLSAVVSRSGFVWRDRVVFSGIPATGTVVNIKLKRSSDHVVIVGGSYTTIAGDAPNNIASGLIMTAPNALITSRFGATVIVEVDIGTYEPFPGSHPLFVQVEIIPPTTATASNSIASWKWSTERNIARAYFDKKGKTNGILYTDKVTFPAYNEDITHAPLLPYINYKINDVPPDWAYSMQFYVTKENTQYIFWQTLSIQVETAYIYFEVTSFATNATKKPTTATVLSYTFQEGDRMRIVRDTVVPAVIPDTYDAAIEGLVVTPTINGTVTATGNQYIKIKNVEPFTSGVFPLTSYVIEIYRPGQQSANKDNQVYYEFGRQYPILDPTLSSRRHSGEVTDQIVGVIPAEYNFYEGDAYFRSRTIASTDTGYQTFNVMDRNFVDFFVSAVSSIDGRANIIDINAKRQYYSTLVRFSEAYQANTNINALNRFYPNNFDEYDYNFGDIVRLKVRDRYIKIFQKFKIGVVPLYNQITKDPNGNNVLVVSDRLLNPIQYRIGNFGLSAPESLASWHFADYGCDTNKAIIWRDSDDGIQPISELYKVDSWATDELPLRTGDSKIYGAIDPKTNKYIIALEAYEVPVPYFGINATNLNSINNSGFTIISSVDFSVDWGDGTTDDFVAGTRHPTHVYLTPYTGVIKILSEDFSGITSININGTVADINPVSNSLGILTSELNKLTGLLSLNVGTSVFIDGITSDLPPLMTFLVVYNTNLSGNVASLPVGITHLLVEGTNHLTGLLSGLPSGIDYLIIFGANTLSGDVSTLPSPLTILYIGGNNTISGNVTGLPSGLTELGLFGLSTLDGDVANFPSTLTIINVSGYNTLFGDVANFPAGVISITIIGYNIISGNVSGIPSTTLFFQITGHNTLTGDLADVPAGIKFVYIGSSMGTVNTYTSGRVWNIPMNSVKLAPGSGGFSTTDVDNILIDLANVTSWIPDKVVSILGSSMSRSAASDAAVATLTGYGVTVTTI